MVRLFGSLRGMVLPSISNQIASKWALRSSGGPFWLRQSVQAIDKKSGKIYFTAMKESSVERHLYSVDLSGKNIEKISKEKGVHSMAVVLTESIILTSFLIQVHPPCCLFMASVVKFKDHRTR